MNREYKNRLQSEIELILFHIEQSLDNIMSMYINTSDEEPDERDLIAQCHCTISNTMFDLTTLLNHVKNIS